MLGNELSCHSNGDVVDVKSTCKLLPKIIPSIGNLEGPWYCWDDISQGIFRTLWMDWDMLVCSGVPEFPKEIEWEQIGHLWSSNPLPTVLCFSLHLANYSSTKVIPERQKQPAVLRFNNVEDHSPISILYLVNYSSTKLRVIQKRNFHELDLQTSSYWEAMINYNTLTKP